MKRSASIDNQLAPLSVSLGLLILWELATRLGGVPAYILPAPTSILRTLVTDAPRLIPHTITTLQEALLGFGLAVVFALILSILMDRLPLVKKALYPLLVLSQTVPIIALAPLFVLWFGFGMLPKIIVVVLVCFFPVAISLIEGFASVDTELVDMMRSMGASQRALFYHVKLPAAGVSFFSGLRIAVTYSIMGAVIGEWLGGSSGLGVYMMRVKQSFDTTKVFAVIVVIVLLSMGLFKLMTGIQKWVMPWDQHRR